MMISITKTSRTKTVQNADVIMMILTSIIKAVLNAAGMKLNRNGEKHESRQTKITKMAMQIFSQVVGGSIAHNVKAALRSLPNQSVNFNF